MKFLEGLSFKPQLSLTRKEAEAASLHLPMTVGNHFNGQISPNFWSSNSPFFFFFLFFLHLRLGMLSVSLLFYLIMSRQEDINKIVEDDYA
jgi:uncharacterized membrane protein